MNKAQPNTIEEGTMGIGVSIFLMAVGAVLAFAVETTTSGVDLDTIGIILMVIGAIGLLFSLLVFGPRRDEVVTTTRERELL
jgi:hypothetical protein